MAAQFDKVIIKLLSCRSDSNFAFKEIRSLLLRLGFDERVRGSHHLFRKDGIREMINIQKDGNMAKPYQIKQIRTILVNNGGQFDV